MPEGDATRRLIGLGFSEKDAATLAAHFDDADRRGKPGHGVARIAWLETFSNLDPTAQPRLLSEAPAFELWDGNGSFGYLTLAAICDRIVANPPDPVRLVAARRCFPTGMLGYWVRRLAEAGLTALLTATSPARLPHPEGGEGLVGTNPLAIGVPDPGGEPIVTDVSMGRVTHGDVLLGSARPDQLVPFGGDHAYKAFALAVGLQGFVESFVGVEHGAVLVAATPEYTGFTAALRARADGVRLPGDS